MTHYICTGECHGESKTSGVCQADDCSKRGLPLLSCDCEDWHHDEIYEKELREKNDDDSLNFSEENER